MLILPARSMAKPIHKYCKFYYLRFVANKAVIAELCGGAT
jgi:hypothetical protein